MKKTIFILIFTLSLCYVATNLDFTVNPSIVGENLTSIINSMP